MPEELIGLRVEIKNREQELSAANNEVGFIVIFVNFFFGDVAIVVSSQISMLLRVLDEKKRREYKQNENEAIQFSFDLNNDKADEVAKEMVRKWL